MTAQLVFLRIVVVALDRQEKVPRGSTFHAHVGSLDFCSSSTRNIQRLASLGGGGGEDGMERSKTRRSLYLCRNQYSLWRESSHFGGKSKQRFTSSNLWMVCGVWCVRVVVSVGIVGTNAMDGRMLCDAAPTTQIPMHRHSSLIDVGMHYNLLL